MLNGQEQLKNIKYEDVHLERYMYGSEFDVDAAFAKSYFQIVLFYDSLRNHPEWYQIVDPLDRMVIIEKDIRVMLPECDKEGRPIYISKNANVNVRTMTLPEVVSVDDIWLESLLANNPQITEKGLCVIVDIAKFLQHDEVVHSRIYKAELEEIAVTSI
ncbi:hypothetical protein NQ317_003930 [Molorchus minor]|uniref:CRAL-TRIO domain-containing protein n=1 Tax=Molorchus minor TaxID=1323400 RepID=A0ABQ9IVG6_9CUCU|nr:hypothetical protein NQ317_003930 [Molorchus minor]